MLEEIEANSLGEAIFIVESKYRTGYDSVFIKFKEFHSELNEIGFLRRYVFEVDAEETCLHSEIVERIASEYWEFPGNIPASAIHTRCKNCGKEINNG